MTGWLSHPSENYETQLGLLFPIDGKIKNIQTTNQLWYWDWCEHLGLSENRVYSQWNSHLIGIMISKTIGFRGLAYFQTHPFNLLLFGIGFSVGVFNTRPIGFFPDATRSERGDIHQLFFTEGWDKTTRSPIQERGLWIRVKVND